MAQDLKKIVLPIKGMHCRSCELLLEDKFADIKQVAKSEVDHRRGVAEIYYSGEEPKRSDLAEAVTSAGYELGENRKLPLISRQAKDYQELLVAALIVLLGFWIIKATGAANFSLDFASNPSGLGVAAIVGLVAGFSTCMALVGGLVLGLSAKFAEKHPGATTAEKFQPHLYFNLGRIGGYGLLGGLLGSLGSFFQLSATVNSILILIAAAAMLYIGLQLIDIFPRLSALKLTLPKGLARLLGAGKQQEGYNRRATVMAGAMTFFLPCGFTQAMQIYAVASGNFSDGGSIMALFALGTTPGLLSVGGLTSIFKGKSSKKFFKIAGLAVIMFAFFNISNGLALSGISLPAKNNNQAFENKPDTNVTQENGQQIVRMVESNSGYSPNSFTIVKGVPVKWIIDAQAPYSCASSLIVPKLNIRKNLTKGENVIEFTPTEVGRLPFSCSMGMYTGVFNVVEKQGDALIGDSSAPEETAAGNQACGAQGGGCGCRH